jgi:hypothetical protein
MLEGIAIGWLASPPAAEDGRAGEGRRAGTFGRRNGRRQGIQHGKFQASGMDYEAGKDSDAEL